MVHIYQERKCEKFLVVFVDQRIRWCDHVKQCKIKNGVCLYALTSSRKPTCMCENPSNLLYYSLVNPSFVLWVIYLRYALKHMLTVSLCYRKEQ